MLVVVGSNFNEQRCISSKNMNIFTLEMQVQFPCRTCKL